MTRKLNLLGLRFGRLIVLSEHDQKTKGGGARWACACDCGRSTVVAATNLRGGQIKSCGCIRPKLVDYSLPRPCTTCGRTLPPEAFRRALCPGSKPEAKKSECKSCADERLRKWKAENPERVAAYQAKYRDSANARAKAASKRDVEQLTDRYVRRLLRNKDADADLVATKKAQVQLIRLIKEKEAR
jgi:hypothetical protein